MKYYVLSLLCLAAMIAYVQRLALGVCEEQIRLSIDLEKPHIGTIIGAWQLGYAMLQLPSGWMADRYGSKPSLAIYMVLWSLCLAAASWCTQFESLVIAWGCMGMAQAGIFPCSTKLISEWFGMDQRATASGILASSMALGIALSPLLTTRLIAQAGLSWQAIFQVYVVPGILLAITIAWTIPRLHRAFPFDSQSEAKSVHEPIGFSWSMMVTSASMWLLCGQQFFRAAAMMFFQSWFPTFLRETRGVDLVTSGNLTFMVGVGAFLGGISGGFFSDWMMVRTGNRRLARQGIAVIGMMSCAALIGISYFVSVTFWAVACIGGGAFLATFGGVSGYTMAIEFGGRQVATTFSMMNMCGNLGAALFPFAVGYMVGNAWGWTSVLVMCVMILIIDAICWVMLNPQQTITGESLEVNRRSLLR